VHGPRIATLLIDLAQREQFARITRFSFKAIWPIFDIHPLRVCGKPSAGGKRAQLWAPDHEG
jgi:3-methylfumaryl-CoA hydratase